MTPSLNGFQIVFNHLLNRDEFVQYKFPKSKKVRIRNKWKKRSSNYRWVNIESYIMDKERRTLYVGKNAWAKIQELPPLEAMSKLSMFL